MYFLKRILSYFAKPNFIIYDEWFDDDLEKTKLILKIKLKTFSNLHDFFMSNRCIKLVFEKHMQLDIKVNKKELITYDNLEKIEKKFFSIKKKFRLFERLIKADLNLISQKN